MKKKGILLFAMLVIGFLLFFTRGNLCQAAEDDNISVTVPTNLHLVFEEDGTNTMTKYTIQNQSIIPIQVNNIHIKLHNGWQLVSWDTSISADQKNLSMKIEGTQLFSGNNTVQFTIPEKTNKALNLSIKRGAWNVSKSSEKAMSIEIEYTPGQKAFQIAFDGNGSDYPINTITANNGDTITLPVPTKIKYAFQGWKDEDGKIHKGNYVVPIGGGKLTAQWVYTTAYAIYSADDKSFTFVRSEMPIQQGSTYQGKTVTSVFTDFEDENIEYYNGVPWWGSSWYQSVTKVIVQDVIQPKSTAYWFFCMRGCGYYDLRNVDTSQLVNMTAMFSSAGEYVTDTVQVIGMGKWNISNVTSLSSTFRGIGSNSKKLIIDDLSGWDTSNVTSMCQTFNYTGYSAEWKMDCSKWNVNKVTDHEYFAESVEEHVIQPKWVR